MWILAQFQVSAQTSASSASLRLCELRQKPQETQRAERLRRDLNHKVNQYRHVVFLTSASSIQLSATARKRISMLTRGLFGLFF